MNYATTNAIAVRPARGPGRPPQTNARPRGPADQADPSHGKANLSGGAARPLFGTGGGDELDHSHDPLQLGQGGHDALRRQESGERISKEERAYARFVLGFRKGMAQCEDWHLRRINKAADIDWKAAACLLETAITTPNFRG